MVHVYNCHPFASQQIVPTDQEPGLVCCGGGALFVVSAGGCKIEAFQLGEDGCPLICRFATMGTVQNILHSEIGDYLVTIEEKNNAPYLRAYTNWRYQAAEKTRVGVRLLGHFLRGSSMRGAPKEQMEIIEIPLFERPLCVACCGVTGDLLVGCPKSLVLFSLKRQALNDKLSILDFERCLIIHLPGLSPQQVAICAGYIALQTELEVLVVKLERLPGAAFTQKSADKKPQDHSLVPQDMITGAEHDNETEVRREGLAGHRDQDDFFIFPKHQELLGDRAKDCGVKVSLEWTGMESEAGGNLIITYILYRRFAPDFFQDCSVEETRLHSLQFHPVFTSNQEVCVEGGRGVEPTCLFCFFSLPKTGYLYSVRGGVQMVSAYQYPEKAQQAVLTDLFLHIITKNALQCFSVRCAAVAARAEDPYIDTTMKACPPITMELCALRIQLFIGLKALCHYQHHIVLLTTADVETREDTERTARRVMNRKSHFTKPQNPSEMGHGWNLYVVNTVPPLQLYNEMVEYSKTYEETNPLSQSCLHLLSEAHLLLRATLLDPRVGNPVERPQTTGQNLAQALGYNTTRTAERQELQQAFQESCAQLGDCFSRFDKRDCHLALPYYKMSGLSLTEVISRNRGLSNSLCGYGKGFLFFLKHSLYEETLELLTEETANEVLDIFGMAEPSQLPHVIASPSMARASPDCGLAHLERLESIGAPSVPLTLSKASLALRMADLQLYRQHMGQHTEMLQVYGFIEEAKLLLHGRGDAVVPTLLARHLRDNQDGLLVAAMVALHENDKVKLDEADLFFQELCGDVSGPQGGPQLLVDFWEALLMASSQEAVIQELLFRLTTVYIDRVTRRDGRGFKPLKSADDLINWCSHYGVLHPWVSILTPAHVNIITEDLHKLQSLLCGPTLDASSILPLLEQLPDGDNAGLSVHVLCATKLGHYESSIERLLDRCPQAIIPYANHELQNNNMALWWQKLFPELCERTRATQGENTILLAALKETLVVVAMELNPLEFLDLLPDDGTVHFFLPHLLECSQRHLMM
ncbi:BLOC-2 complex member HPS3 isoform X2 [Salmo salar]|uniref:BLOC-2 complex member HPS3 isoform X2 n=1 Tax=Salmo salar TaxID=8030 RepID=A0A1S3KK29_SALSA|nr:Hermansky-Pudlak syndrome 3 protein isoform X2 [Salmo salar]|eukprot:XP_013979101.1 PREDICTED: Hermansky-Pudlak syndrome 3 protein isoform X2 [Salmo salar]